MTRHAIIAGSNKSGTTSLFRYLAAHPGICASKIKEMNFFSGLDDVESCMILDHYQKQIRLEASPDYLRGGKELAEKIKKVLPDARLIFMLREPASRIVSYYSSNKINGFHHNVAKVDFDDYVRAIEGAIGTDFGALRDGVLKNAQIQFHRGCYAKYLEEYLSVFSANQIYIVFFDDLVNDAKEAVMGVAEFLGIDKSFYADYIFSVENKTKQARWPAIQRHIFRLNMALEPVLNSIPTLRVLGRKLVFKNSGAAPRIEISDGSLARLKSLYETKNQDLARLLCSYFPDICLPSWLR